MKRFFSTTYNTTVLNIWLLVLRLSVGAFMLTHGIPKFERLMEGNTQFLDLFGFGETASLVLAVFAELFCSVLIMVGLGTRLASFVLVVTMLAAAFIAHGADPFAKKEMALLYLLHYLSLLVIGAGKYSVDHLISKKLNARNQNPFTL